MRESFISDVSLVQGHFIIATPLLLDPFFQKSIILMSEFQEYISYGFLVDYVLHDSNLLTSVQDKLKDTIFDSAEVFLGGPIDPDTLFLIHSSDVFYKKTLKISSDISVTNLSYALENFSYTPSFYRIVAGYCHWKVGQLEDEIKKGFWLLKDFSNNIMFSKSKKKWQSCIESFSIDLKKFSLSSGVA